MAETATQENCYHVGNAGSPVFSKCRESRSGAVTFLRIWFDLGTGLIPILRGSRGQTQPRERELAGCILMGRKRKPIPSGRPGWRSEVAELTYWGSCYRHHHRKVGNWKAATPGVVGSRTTPRFLDSHRKEPLKMHKASHWWCLSESVAEASSVRLPFHFLFPNLTRYVTLAEPWLQGEWGSVALASQPL